MTTTKRVPNRFSGTPDFPYLKKTNLKQGAHHIQKPTTWPVPHACAQPYHPGSGSHGQLFRPYWGLFEARDFGFESKIEASLEMKVCLGCGMPKITLGITEFHEMLGRDYGIEEPYSVPSTKRELVANLAQRRKCSLQKD